MRASSILTAHSEMFCESFLQLSTTYCKSWQEHQLLPSITYSNLAGELAPSCHHLL